VARVSGTDNAHRRWLQRMVRPRHCEILSATQMKSATAIAMPAVARTRPTTRRQSGRRKQRTKEKATTAKPIRKESGKTNQPTWRINVSALFQPARTPRQCQERPASATAPNATECHGVKRRRKETSPLSWDGGVSICVEWPNDPSSATRPTGRHDCNGDAQAGFAAAHG